jgi:TorA maturation chaperone TorD
MPATTQPLKFSPAEGHEELARAELYGLIARLWLAPPDAALLQQFASVVTEAPEAGAYLEAPWQALVGALRQATLQTAADEYDALFLGVGKPEVFLYGSYYLAGFLNERPLARLREDLSQLGLTRTAERGETEDHIAYLCEVMRYLIAGDEIAVCNLEQQRRFFRAHLQPWVEQFCDVVAAHPRAQLWRVLADFTRAFVQVEMQGFDLLED